MANNTKTQIKKRIEELKEKLSDLRLEFEDLQSDIEIASGRPHQNNRHERGA